MNKKAILGIVVSIILVVTAVEVVGFLQSQTPHCSVDLYNPSCFCYENEVRGQYTEAPEVYQYICYPSEPPEPGFDLPIETWEEALEFVEFNFGTSQCTCGMEVNCEQVDMLLLGPFSPVEPFAESGPIPEGIMVGPVELQCVHMLTPDSGGLGPSRRVWGIRFFPRSGNIWERWCNSDYMVDCPSRIRPISIIHLLATMR